MCASYTKEKTKCFVKSGFRLLHKQLLGWFFFEPCKNPFIKSIYFVVVFFHMTNIFVLAFCMTFLFGFSFRCRTFLPLEICGKTNLSVKLIQTNIDKKKASKRVCSFRISYPNAYYPI